MSLDLNYRLFIVTAFLSILLSACASRSSITPEISTNTPLAPTSTVTPPLSTRPMYSFTPPITIQQFTATPITPAQTEIPNQSPTITPTNDYAKYVDAWNTYKNERFGFSFDYPAIYDTPSYSSCRIQELTSEPWIFYLMFGHRSEFAIANNDLSTFSDYVDRWVQSMIDRKDWSLESRYGRVINGSQAITIEYRFSFRGGTTTFFDQKNHIYILNWTAGGGCDIPEIKLNEYYAYNHAIDTFKLYTPHP